MKKYLLSLVVWFCSLAEGAIIHVNNPFPDVAPGLPYTFGLAEGPEQLDIDFNKDGQADLRFASQGSMEQVIVVTNVFAQSGVREDTNNMAVVLHGGELIGVGSTYFPGTRIVMHAWSGNTSLILTNNAASSTGNWPSQTGFLGFWFSDTRVIDGEIVGGDRHFGWIRMSGGQGSLTFHEWAFETEDMKPLLAGQIPEPSAAMFLGLSLAIRCLRRSRI